MSKFQAGVSGLHTTAAGPGEPDSEVGMVSNQARDGHVEPEKQK